MLTSFWSPRTRGRQWPSWDHHCHKWRAQGSEQLIRTQKGTQPASATPPLPEGILTQWLLDLVNGKKESKKWNKQCEKLYVDSLLVLRIYYIFKWHNSDWIKPLVFTCSLCVHLNTHYTQVRRADAHSSPFIPTFAFGLSHFFNGVNAHDGHTVPRHYTITQVPSKILKSNLNI